MDVARIYGMDCEYESSDLGWDEPFVVESAAELLGPFLGEHTADGSWVDGGALAVMVSVDAADEQPYTTEVVGGDDADQCSSGDHYIPYHVDIVVSDDIYDESYQTEWVLRSGWEQPNSLRFGGELDVDEPSGLLQDYVEPDEELISAHLSLSLTDNGDLSGEAVVTVWGHNADSEWDLDRTIMVFGDVAED